MRTFLMLTTLSCFVVGCSTKSTKTDSAKSSESPAKTDTKSESAKSEAKTQNEANAKTAKNPPSTESGPLIIDVRSKEEWDEGHLEEATLIPLPEIRERIGEVAKNKDQKIYLHCRSGGRSGQAKTQLEELGYTNVENVGGLEDARAKFEPATK